MGKITESIDLTLNSYFAGDDDRALKPTRWRDTLTHPDWFFSEDERDFIGRFIRFHVEFLCSRSIDALQFLREPSLHDAFTFAYLAVFGEFPQWAYEETLGYGDPRHCPKCGMKVNLLTRGDFWDTCDKCRYQDSLMSIQI